MNTQQSHLVQTDFNTLIDVLQHHAQQRPDQVAFTFLSGSSVTSLTYGELDQKARALAAHLQNICTVGDRVLVLYEQNLDYLIGFFGTLYAGMLGVPAYPPTRNKQSARLTSILTDAEPTGILTNADKVELMNEWLHEYPRELTERINIIASDTLPDTLAELWEKPEDVHGDTVAYLQYTSGSTSAAKGVQVTHSNLLYNTRMLTEGFHLSDESVIVSWLPFFHDMGLIGMVLTPMSLGAHAVLMAPLTFIQNPTKWLQAISTYRGTFSAAPNFAYDLCIRRVKPDKKKSLDLSSWKAAANASEPVRMSTCDRFIEAFKECGLPESCLHPSYGLAEATLLVSGGRPEGSLHHALICDRKALELGRVEPVAGDHPDAVRIPACGAWLSEVNVVIADKDQQTAYEEGQVGEIWVGGPSVAIGYANKPEITEQTYRAYLSDTNEGPFLRTGDLGFVYEGELYWTGRLKDMIIIDGTNHYPQDIELTVEKHPAIRNNGAAAFSVEVDEQERVCVICEVETTYLKENPETDFEKIRKAIRMAITAEHEVETYRVLFVKAGRIPRTSSGKLQRHACRKSFLENTVETLD